MAIMIRGRFGLRAKFILIVTALLFLALGGWGGLVVFQETHQLKAELQARAERTAVVQLSQSRIVQARREEWLSVLQLGVGLGAPLSLSIWFLFPDGGALRPGDHESGRHLRPDQESSEDAGGEAGGRD